MTFSEDRASERRFVCALAHRFVYRMLSILFYNNRENCTQSWLDMSSKRRTTMWPKGRLCTAMLRSAQ